MFAASKRAATINQQRPARSERRWDTVHHQSGRCCCNNARAETLLGRLKLPRISGHGARLSRHVDLRLGAQLVRHVSLSTLMYEECLIRNSRGVCTSCTTLSSVVRSLAKFLSYFWGLVRQQLDLSFVLFPSFWSLNTQFLNP